MFQHNTVKCCYKGMQKNAMIAPMSDQAYGEDEFTGDFFFN